MYRASQAPPPQHIRRWGFCGLGCATHLRQHSLMLELLAVNDYTHLLPFLVKHPFQLEEQVQPSVLLICIQYIINDGASYRNGTFCWH